MKALSLRLKALNLGALEIVCHWDCIGGWLIPCCPNDLGKLMDQTEVKTSMFFSCNKIRTP